MASAKKIGLGFGALVIAGALYYFTIGSTQITQEIKRHIDKEVATLSNKGFSIENREVKEKSEHFVISFDDPKKIGTFLIEKGLQISLSDAEVLKGLKLGVDLFYLKDAYSSISFDVYPLSLPTIITTSTNKENGQNTLAHIQKLLDKKTFLMHLDVNKLGSAFKGNLKDINEVIVQDEKKKKNLTLVMTGFSFSGELKEKSLHEIKQKLKKMSMQIPHEMQMSLTGVDAAYTFTGKTAFDYHATYTIDTLQTEIINKLNLTATDLVTKAVSSTKDGLANATMKSTIKQIDIKAATDSYRLHKFAFDITTKNLDVKAFEQLQTIDPNDEKQVKETIQKFFSRGIVFEIPTLSVANIEINTNTLGGLDMEARMALDKSLNIQTLERNPMASLSAIDANIKLSLSKEIYVVLAQQPQVMMIAMMFQPKDVNGKKVYDLQLKNGKVLVNGKPIL